MSDSASSFLAIIFGLGVFAVIVAIGWRSVQNRRILRLQGANGQETIIVAREDDEISSVVTTTETTHAEPAPASPVVVVNTGTAEPVPAQAPAFGRREGPVETDAQVDAAGQDRLRRVVSSTE
jgi:cytoskeletal protein RodZ